MRTVIPASVSRQLGPVRAVCFAAMLIASLSRSARADTTLFGFTPFPYDFTLSAVRETRRIIAANSTIYALHFDDGVPWKQALADAPFPDRVRRDWDDMAGSVPPGMKVYVGLAPLATDRLSIAPAAGERRREPVPPELRGVPLDDPKLETAYLNYARRAVRRFKPDFLNLGIEAGGVLMRDPVRWPQFVRLYEHVRAALKRESPKMQIGISFSLGQLRVPANAEAARPLIASSDYVGLSFYPSAWPFDEKFGLPPYGKGADAWRKPLAWVRAYTDRPIALCETGCTTRNCDIPQFHLHIQGDPQMQADYVRDLFTIARRDRYAFVIWFLAIDYDRLYAKMPPGSQVMELWENIGLFDSDVHPKPAWAIWRAGVAASAK